MATKRKGEDKDHHLSRTGLRGTPKKGGFAAKGGWGRAEDEEGPAVIDEKDPNFVPEDEEANTLGEGDGEEGGETKTTQ